MDVVLSMAILVPTQFMLGYYERQVGVGEGILWSLATFALWFILHGVLIAKGGQTIGKRLMSIRVVTMESGEAASLTRYALARELPVQLLAVPMIVAEELVPLMVMGVPLATFVWGFVGLADTLLIFRADRRCAHDLIAGTRVVRA